MTENTAGNDALIQQRRGGKSINDLNVLTDVVGKNPGYTMTQASWVASGGWVDDKGFCQPREEFNRTLRFFNFKRRGSEAAFMPTALADHPKARFQYGKAVRNPYDFGGAGVYPVGMGQPKPVVVDIPRAEGGGKPVPMPLAEGGGTPVPMPSIPVSERIAGMIADMG